MATTGLGAALTSFGNSMMARQQDQLKERLEKEREARADERAKAKELRDAQREAGTKLVKDDSGEIWVQGVNSAGRDVGAPTRASAQDIKNYNQEETTKQNKMSLDALTLLGKEKCLHNLDNVGALTK